MLKFTMPMLFASAALLAAAPAAAQYGSYNNYDQSAPRPDSYDRSGDRSYASSGDQDQRPRHQRGMRMSLEQRAMWRAEIRQQIRNVPREQRKAYVQQLKAEWRSMDPGQRQQKFAQMERNWNALPADKRERILAKMSQRNGRSARGQYQQDGAHYQDGNYQDGNHQYRDGGDRYRGRGDTHEDDADLGETDQQ